MDMTRKVSMDSDRFDAFTAQLTTRLSRRRSLGLLTAVGMTGVAAIDETAAKKSKKKKKKKTCPPAVPCPAPVPPPPPQPFCASNDPCQGAINCQAAGPTCFCWVRADNGQPFCGQTARLVASCAACITTEVCIALGGPACPSTEVGCSSGCQNPR
jgi:hypothetical protein